MKQTYKPCKIVAEICCNHMGDFNIAQEMIKTAKICGADYVKFQKRNPELSTPDNFKNQPHPCPVNAFGETYLEHRKALEFNINQHIELLKLCNELNIGYSSSVWDIDSAKDIISLNPDFIKIPSAQNYNFKLLDYLYNNYKNQIHISLGMSKKEEIENLKIYLKDKKERTVVYWTTSDYPVKFEELFLLELSNLKNEFPDIGYSGHHLGIAIDMAAIALGASWIERHFTLDRTWKGTDQAASLEPTGLQKLCRDTKALHKALQYKEIELTEGEIKNRNKLRN